MYIHTYVCICIYVTNKCVHTFPHIDVHTHTHSLSRWRNWCCHHIHTKTQMYFDCLSLFLAHTHTNTHTRSLPTWLRWRDQNTHTTILLIVGSHTHSHIHTQAKLHSHTHTRTHNAQTHTQPVKVMAQMLSTDTPVDISIEPQDRVALFSFAPDEDMTEGRSWHIYVCIRIYAPSEDILGRR